MALNKLKFNSLNVTPTAGKTIGFNSSANGLEATFSGGDMQFIKKLTASSSSTLSFVDGSSDVVLDNTYKEYLFLIIYIHQLMLLSLLFKLMLLEVVVLMKLCQLLIGEQDIKKMELMVWLDMSQITI